MESTSVSRTLRTVLGSVGSRAGDAVVRRVGIDLRALAAFRICLGSVLLLDLVLRTRHLTAFYTDYGVLPREALYSDYSGVYSIHAAVGEPGPVAALFILQMGFAVALIVGYRTRLVTAVSWILLLSLHYRNPMVLNAGDRLLGMLLFWAMFLPVAERWSLDARRFDRDRDRAATIATLAILLQVVFVYLTNSYHKSQSDDWMSGEAVAWIMQADHITYLLGDYLAEFPALLRPMTYVWVGLLFASPLLLLTKGYVRALVATLLAGMHFGMFLTMSIGLFPIISMTGLVLFYPSFVWDRATALASRSDHAVAVRDRLARVEAPYPGDGGLERAMGLLPQETAASLLSAGRGAFMVGIPYVMLVLVIFSNADTVADTGVPEPGAETLDTAEMDQSWRMYAPNPASKTRWFAAPATTDDGREIDAFHGGDVTRDRPPNPAEQFPSYRWRKYLTAMRFADNNNHRSYYANHLCGQWSRDHDADLESVTVYYAFEETHPDTGEVVDSGEVTLRRYDCDGPLVQE